MAFTKLYLTSVAAPFTPTNIRGTWDDSAGPVTLKLAPLKLGGGTSGSVSRAETNAAAGFKVLLYRGVSVPLAAQTLSGSLDVIIGALESAADADLYWALHVYVTVGDSDTVRATLLANYTENTTNEFPTTAAGHTFQGSVPLTSAPIGDGDRLVVELGYIARNATATSKSGTLNYGTVDGSGNPLSDLTDGSTSVTTLAGFLEFSRPILEYGTNVAVTTLAGPTTVGPQVYGGFGFRPKAVLVWSTGQTADGITDGWHWSIGAATASIQGVRADAHADNAGTTDNHGACSPASIVWLVDATGTTLLQGAISGLSDDGFTINWAICDGTSRLLNVMLIGGDNVAVAAGLLEHPPRSQVGVSGLTQDINCGFTPDLVLFLGGVAEGAGTPAVQNEDNNGASPGFGWATRDGATNMYATTIYCDGVGLTSSDRYQKTNRCIYHYNATLAFGFFGDVPNEGHLSDYLPEGFRLTWDVMDGTGRRRWWTLWIAFTGLQVRGFSFTKPTSATTKAVTGIGFTPGALLLQTFSNIANAGPVVPASLMIGATDGLNQCVTNLYTTNLASPTQEVRTQHSARVVKATTGAATGSSATVIAEATVQSYDADGFTLAYSVSSATAHEVIGLAFGGVYTPAGAAGDCDGGGLVDTGTNPSAPASLAGAQVPLVYLTLQTASGERAYGLQSIVDATFIEGRIQTIGPIRRALSDWFGGFQTSTCTVTLYDTDRAIRALHDAGTLMNRQVDIYMTSQAILAASGTARRLGQFIVRRYQPAGDYTFTLELEDLLGSQLSDFATSREFPTRTFTVEDFPTLGNPTTHATDPGNPSLIGKRVPICYGSLTDTADGVDAIGVVPCHYVGTRQLGSGGAEKWDEYVVCGHAVAFIQEWFAAASPVDQRIKMDPGTEGIDFLIPGSAGWIARLGTDLFVDYNTRRYTVIFARGPRSTAAREGRVPITLNLCGIEAAGDGTGDVIDALPYQILHFLNNFVIQDYGGGAWAGIPNVVGVPFTYSRIDTESFDDVVAIAQARVTGGYLGAWILGSDGTPVPLFELLQRMCLNADLDLGVNRHGQIMASMVDPAAGATHAFTDIVDVLDGSLNPILAWDYLANRYTYRYERRYVAPITNPTPATGDLLPGAIATPAGDWLSSDDDEDATSITDHQETKPVDIELGLIRDADTADSVITERLARTKDVPVLPEFRTGLQGTDPDLGSVIALTAASGLSGSGWTDRVVRVREVEVDPVTCAVTLRGHDIADL